MLIARDSDQARTTFVFPMPFNGSEVGVNDASMKSDVGRCHADYIGWLFLSFARLADRVHLL